MFDLANEIWQTMRTNKLRTALTGLAVAWGIFMLIVLLGMAQGVLNSFTDGTWAQTSNALQVWPGMTGKPFKGLKEGRAIELRESDLDLIESRNGAKVEYATATLSSSSVTISSPKDYVTASYMGVFPGEAKQNGLKMIRGRFINQNDIDNKRKVIVMEHENASLLFPDSLTAIGSKVNINGLMFTLIGIYEHDWQTRIYIPFSTARILAGNNDKVNSMTLTIKGLKTKEDGELIEKEVRTTLGSRHRFDPDDESAVWMWNKFTSYLSNLEVFNILEMVVWVIGILTLISGIVGVSNIMFVSVRERTHEIGIRRAIGAKPRSILLQVIAESVAITTLFGYIGVVAGVGVSAIITKVFEGSDFLKNPSISLSIALEVTLVLIIAGALAGVFPAMRALKIKPVEALRTE